jgi:hypothetical protein
MDPSGPIFGICRTLHDDFALALQVNLESIARHSQSGTDTDTDTEKRTERGLWVCALRSLRTRISIFFPFTLLPPRLSLNL